MGAHSVNNCLSTMRTILILACVTLASTKHLYVKIDQLEYGFCDGSAEPAAIDTATVEPLPIVVATGETITLSVQIPSMRLYQLVLRSVSRSRKKDSFLCPFLVSRLMVFILGLVIMMVTTCWSLELRPSVLTTSLMVRSACSP